MRSFLKSFLFAFRGIKISFQNQRNILIQLSAGAAVLSWSAVIRLPGRDYAIILILCFLVIILEMINTAMEKLADMVKPVYHKKIGDIKDILAGAVLLAAILSVIAGAILLAGPSAHFIRNLLQTP